MITIKMSVYEKADLLSFLDYAKEKKIEDCNNDIITPLLLNIELERIKILKNRIKGKFNEDYQQMSRKYLRQFEREKDDLPETPFDDIF